MVKPLDRSVGLLGGSFDPAHKGHLAISKIAINKIKLGKVLWIVTNKNPFKIKPFYSISQRMNKAKKITKGVKKIKVVYLDKAARSSRSIDVINLLIVLNTLMM
mgnify:CR=1 FL=1